MDTHKQLLSLIMNATFDVVTDIIIELLDFDFLFLLMRMLNHMYIHQNGKVNQRS